MTTPTGDSNVAITETEATVQTPKIDVHPKGSIFGTIDAEKTLMSEALGECMIEIISLRYMTAEKSHQLGNGKKCCVPRGLFEKEVVKICKHTTWNGVRSQLRRKSSEPRSRES
jgi:hypothetical protein